MSLVFANIVWSAVVVVVVVALIVIGALVRRVLQRRGVSGAAPDDVREQEDIRRAATQDRERIESQRIANEGAARSSLNHRSPIL